jgi:hypothetical protein
MDRSGSRPPSRQRGGGDCLLRSLWSGSEVGDGAGDVDFLRLARPGSWTGEGDEIRWGDCWCRLMARGEQEEVTYGPKHRQPHADVAETDDAVGVSSFRSRGQSRRQGQVATVVHGSQLSIHWFGGV